MRIYLKRYALNRDSAELRDDFWDRVDLCPWLELHTPQGRAYLNQQDGLSMAYAAKFYEVHSYGVRFYSEDRKSLMVIPFSPPYVVRAIRRREHSLRSRFLSRSKWRTRIGIIV